MLVSVSISLGRVRLVVRPPDATIGVVEVHIDLGLVRRFDG